MKNVLPNGKLIETRKVPAHAVGLDLKNSLLGAGE
ncbi:hypothetical protein LCGC14_1114110 [marine sediment metagenome]|uniref:Uncharacterized protein n=1 Tax=marine sediment metagenome TaxID=412755 RepID=A0A0F9QBY3_9ZZZZ